MQHAPFSIKLFSIQLPPLGVTFILLAMVPSNIQLDVKTRVVQKTEPLMRVSSIKRMSSSALFITLCMLEGIKQRE